MSIEFEIKAKIDGNELWSAVFGSGFEQLPWWKSLKFVNCDWNKMPTDQIGHVRIGVEDPEFGDEETVQYEDIKIADLVRGLEACIEKGYHHCGMPISLDFQDYDSCAGDFVLQCAIFGDTVYA